MIVRPTEPIKRAGSGVEQVTALIKRRGLKPGQRLPAERALVRQLGMSRTSVREALRTLEGLGVVEVRPGRGTFLRTDVQSGLRAQGWEEYLSRQRDRVLDILEVRELLDARAAALAARRASPDEIAALEDLLREMGKAVEANDVDALVDVDIRFHSLIARISRNALLAELASSMLHALRDDREATFRLPGRPMRSLQEHRAILNAIGRGEAEAAERHMRRHVRQVKHHLLRMRPGP